MILRWLNAEKDVLFVEYDDGRLVAIGSSDTDWASLSVRLDISPFIAEAVDLNVARAGMILTRRQVFIGMADSGLITATEAIAAAATGVTPAAIEAVFLMLPTDDQTPARITFAAFQSAYRLDAMTSLLQTTAGLTDAQMDDFFTTYATI